MVRARHASGIEEIEDGERISGMSSDNTPAVESCQQFPFRNFWTVPAFYFLLTVAAGVPIVLGDTNADGYNDAGAHWNRVLMLLAGHVLPQVDPDNGSQVGYATGGGFVALNNTAVNSPFLYWPSLLSGGNRTLAALLTLLTSAAVVALAIRLAGRFQLLMAAAALVPMTFLSFVYPTADAVTVSVSFLFIGLILYLLQRPGLRPVDWVALCVVAVMLGQLKVTCVLLVALVLLLAGKLDGWKKLWLAVPAVFAVASCGLWNRLVSGFAPAPGRVSAADYTALKSYCLSHPLAVVRSLLATMFMPLNDSTETIDGVKVNIQRNVQLFTGSEGTPLGSVVMVPVLLAVVLLAVYSVSLARVRSTVSQVVMALIVVGFFAATVVAMLASWTGSVGGYAEGMQSRYFIPVLPLFFLLLPRFFRCDRPRFLLACCAALIAWSYIGLVVAHLW
ncbi:DUF2142 domain-containing protein [Bifidobacterium choloepi]|uniref:DUF2142 domain-containing protein n=1 Tax=Bifidobacterium choloepi TaxID=2614131 RepID=A0A6I5N1Z3_9BIFI|nr:DUF2142 domain-containing protein [Bifidobacterium choloepi]NEG70496.1 DUF2142 domain-containing protein [Bifidobacterium choloepi]